ncbi:hypothetical protein ACYATP_00090 [Lactobacillaceae bacterium Melli_B4]
MKNKNLMLLLASTMMIGIFTTAISPINDVVNASSHHKHNKKKVKKAKKQVTIATKTTQTLKKSDGIKPVSDYPTTGDWYMANGKALYNKYHNSDAFYQGQTGRTIGGVLDVNMATNSIYRIGWVLGYVNDNGNVPSVENGASVDVYNKDNDIYQSGVDYINAHNIHSGASIIYSFDDSGNISWRQD